ncbi:hypothetical protein [Dongshaea marina]|uniref:hypothetical protein n=1 Tax=Dongshaea marina TaxID=2047966 RepID=UPI00131EF7E6|nr:hypothetical protein [Dongshaea marina]
MNNTLDRRELSVSLPELLETSHRKLFSLEGIIQKVSPIFGMGWRWLVCEDLQKDFEQQAAALLSVKLADHKNLQILIRLAAEFSLETLSVELGYVPDENLREHLADKIGCYRLQWCDSSLVVTRTPNKK